MRRDVDLNEISDGKLYTSNDMVKADCYDCRGVRHAVAEWENPSFWIPLICFI